MKTIFLLAAILIIGRINVSAQIIHVPGDQPTIQAGINIANDGDTVLVDPGIYGENIIIDKHITVASLLLLTGNTSYINQTIIECLSISSVVSFTEGLDSTSLLMGFKLINGQGGHFMGNNWGGGVTAIKSSPTLCNLYIAYNNAPSGGGIYCDSSSMILNNIKIYSNSASGMGGGIYCINNSNIHLSNVNIYNNLGDWGGGIYCSENSILTFDDINRCDIYLNFAINGKDLFSHDFIELVLDTFSVQYPTQYYVEPLENFSFDIDLGIIDQVDADLYVAPDGDNSNSGLTEEEALKNIDYATSIIRADSLHHHIIHLSEGQFSPSTTYELFPIRVYDYVDLKGASINMTILDAEQQSRVMELISNSSSKISNLQIKNGNAHTYSDGEGGGIKSISSSALLQNLKITDNETSDQGGGGSGGGIYMYESNLTLIDLSIANNIAYDGVFSGGPNPPGKGGGIFCGGNSNPVIQDLTITNNTASSGGGIYSNGQPQLKNVLITNNHSRYGGGIYSLGSITFDENNRCNIYYNEADYGDEIYCTSENVLDVIVDTFSVLLPHDYHASPIDKINFDILNSVVEQIDADLFISPDGDNNNSGLTAEDPLKNINHAIYRIVSDSINPYTIHLLKGIYSPTINDESYPIRMISNIKLRGESANNVILNIQGASKGIEIYNLNALTISDISILGNPEDFYDRGISCKESSLVLQNLRISNFNGYLEGWSSLNGGGMYFQNSNATLNNLVITDNIASSGGGIYCWHSILNLQNITISDNRAYSPISGIERGGGIYSSDSSTITLINTIMWNDSTQEIYFDENYASNEVNINRSDIQDGPAGVITNGNGNINWLEGNIDENPLFAENGENPYSLTEGSPCVDMGTTDTTGLNLLPFDILGNIRIWDGNGDDIAFVDIGSYEYGSQPLNTSNALYPNSDLSFRNYPNPFSKSTFFEFYLTEKGDVTICIYNISGQLHETITLLNKDKGKNTVEWNPKKLSLGIYYCKLITNDPNYSGHTIKTIQL